MLLHDIHTTQPINKNHNVKLDEATYKELKSLYDDNFLKQKYRTSVLEKSSYIGMIENTMYFKVNSSEFEKNGILYTNRIEFEEFFEQAKDVNTSTSDIANLLMNYGNIKVHCTCPSFLYWGYQYLSTAIDASVEPENRNPVIKIPDERGIVCKHLRKTLNALPFQKDFLKAGIDDYRKRTGIK